MPLIDTKAFENATAGIVTVSMFPDFAMPGAAASGGDGGSAVTNGSSGGGNSVASSLLNEGVVKYVSLGGLAVVSLGMMLMMVRKAGVREQMPTASAPSLAVSKR
jgi:hypothetical protein